MDLSGAVNSWSAVSGASSVAVAREAPDTRTPKDRPMDTIFWMILLLMLCCCYLFHAARSAEVEDDDQQTIAKTQLRPGPLVPVVSVNPVRPPERETS